MHWTVIVVAHSLKEKPGNVASWGGKQKSYIKVKGEEQEQYTEMMIQSNQTYLPTNNRKQQEELQLLS